jgi:hypothetical protein
MLWGMRESFAIEAAFLGTEGKWRFGNLRFWLGGSALGDFEDTSDLAGAGRWGRTFLDSSPRRTRKDLECSSPEVVLWELFEKYVSPGGARIKGGWDRDPYLLDDVGEASLRDRASVLAFRASDGRDHLIARNWKTGETLHVVEEAGHLDEVIRSFCEWCESLQ